MMEQAGQWKTCCDGVAHVSSLQQCSVQQHKEWNSVFSLSAPAGQVQRENFARPGLQALQAVLRTRLMLALQPQVLLRHLRTAILMS